MAEKDQGAKAIIQLRPADFIQQVLPGAEYLGPLETDVATEPQLMLDSLYAARYRGLECAINFEIQARYDKDVPRRMFEYGSSGMRVHGRPVISVVLWLPAKGRVPTSPYRVRVGDLPVVDWHFISIEVRKLSASAMISSGPLGLLPFVPFMGDANEQLAEQALRRVKEQAPQDQRDTLAFIMTIFIAQVYKSEELARAIIRRVFMSTDLFKESPLYQSLVKEAAADGIAKGRAEGIAKGRAEGIAEGRAEGIAEGRAEGIAEGRAEGIAEGITEGRAEGMRGLAQSALEGRFGTLSADMLQALNRADEAALKAVVVSDTLEQVRQHLGLGPQG